MKTGGFITLHRQILDWEWYKEPNTFCLFVYLLLTANYEDGRFQGRVVKRGQLVTSLTNISTNTGLTIRQTRTALEHLISTGEVTNESTSQYRVISIVNYDKYQSERQTIRQTNDKQSTNELTNDRQTDRQTNRQQYNNNNNNNKDTNEQGNNIKRDGSAKRFIPPTREEVDLFCRENGLSIDVDYFIDYYNGNGWMAGKNKMKDWEATVRNWARRENRGSVPQQKPQKVLPAQDFQQRNYDGVQDEILTNLSKEMALFKATGKVDM